MDQKIILLHNTILYKGKGIKLLKTINPSTGLYGIYNKVNKQLICPCIFKYICLFTEGLGAVQLNRKWGFIDSDGQLTSLLYDEIVSPFINKVAIVKNNSQLYSIDKFGDETLLQNKTNLKILKKGDYCICDGNGCDICQYYGYIPLNYQL